MTYDEFREAVYRIKPPDVSRAAVNEVIVSKILPAKMKELTRIGTLTFYPFEARRFDEHREAVLCKVHLKAQFSL